MNKSPYDDLVAACAAAIWRETYRHDTLMAWGDVLPGTLHHQRTMDAARAVASLLHEETAGQDHDLGGDTAINWNK